MVLDTEQKTGATCEYQHDIPRAAEWFGVDPKPHDLGRQEWFYTLSVGPESRYGAHIIYFVAGSTVFEPQDEEGFVPPLDSAVVRFTLCHPFLQPEVATHPSTKVLVDSFSKGVIVTATKLLVDRNSAMPKKKTLSLTNAEHRIMEVIWARGSATVAEVVEALKGKDAYTTILTLMRILKAKGYLSTRKEGRAFKFAPRVDRDTVARKAVHQLLAKFFAGSPSELVLSFLREEELTPAELEVIKQKILKSEDERDEK